MLQAFFLFFVGASLGSLFVSIVERGSLKKILFGKAHCDNCALEIKGHCLIPVVSWLCLRGRCSRCKKFLPFTYLLFEAGLGLAFVLLWSSYFGLELGVIEASRFEWMGFLRDLFFTLVFAFLFLQDLSYKTLSDKIIFFSLIAALVFNFALGNSFQSMVIGSAAVGGFLFLQYAISRGKWIGGGDVKFGVLLGTLLGAHGGPLALLSAYVLGVSVAIVMLLSGIATRKTMVPFGAFMALAGFVVMLYADELFEILKKIL
jgi:prepilin signal peptidase PulO-like enzyme (type II secretory pathway)